MKIAFVANVILAKITNSLKLIFPNNKTAAKTRTTSKNGIPRIPKHDLQA